MAAERKIKVLLADDHTMFRQGLKEMLATDEQIEVVGEAEDGQEALALAGKLQPDVVLLDVEMPVMGARETMERMLGLPRRPEVVVVTMYDDPRLVRELMGLGASGYLVKNATIGELLTAVHFAAEKPTGPKKSQVIIMPPEIMSRPEQKADDLSQREMEVLLLAARGMSNRQIAASLHLSEATVKRHLANIYPKMGVTSRGEATSKALREGWISARDVTEDAE